MSSEKAQRIYDRITHRYVFGLLLIAVTIFGEQYVAHRIVASAEHDAYALNVSGTQRMWSQRVISISQQLIANNQMFNSLEMSTEEQRIDILKTGVDEMRATHRMLTMGDASLNFEPTTDIRLTELYFGEGGVDYMLRYFLSLADQVVSDNETGRDATNSVSMMVMLRDRLLDGLDAAVSTYVDISTEKKALLRNIQSGHVAVIVVLLIFEILFIFRPMARRAKSAMEELVREKNQLNDSLERETEIASFAENAPEPIISLDADGRFLYANPRAEEIVVAIKKDQISPATLLGAPLKTFLLEPSTMDFSFTLDGRVYEGVAVPYTGGKFVNFYFHDVTALKEAEEKASNSQRMEAIGQLTGGVAHDFNNLLMVITGSLQLALSKLKVGDQHQTPAVNLIESALGAVDRTTGLTRNLLAFSRRQPLAPENINISDAISSFQPLLRNAAGAIVSLEIRNLDEHRGTIEVDRGQFEAAMLNLVINARDAMPDGGKLLIESKRMTVSPEVTARFDDLSPGEYAVVAVTDDGVGIPAHIRSKVLEPFFTTKEVGQGSGLGLSMIWGFVKQSGGHVTIYSESGIGTTVRLFFPLSEKTISLPTEAPSIDAVPALPAGDLVLIAEDNGDLRDWLTNELKALGYKVAVSATAKEALRAIKERPEISFVISDIFMPDGMTGLELSEEVYAYRPDLPVLLISGFPSGSMPSMKGQRVLSKPFSRAELARELTRAARGEAA